MGKMMAMMALCAISQVGFSVKVSEFGYDPEDSTRFIQAAFDSPAKRIVFDRQRGPWVSLPLCGTSNKEIVFEDGVELLAKRGAFTEKYVRLLTFDRQSNVVIRGEGRLGGALRMWKSDYINKRKYCTSEWRHALSLRGVKDFRVENMRFLSSGGDGLGVGVSRTNGVVIVSENVVIRKCLSDDNVRQGLTVGGCRHLLVEDTVFSNTRGLAPQAGVDLEPDDWSACLVDCVFRNCRAVNNAGGGFEVLLQNLKEKTPPVSITFDSCVSTGNWQDTWASAGSRDVDCVQGVVRYVNCRFEGAHEQGIAISGVHRNSFRVEFDRCTLHESESGWRANAVLFRPNGGYESLPVDKVTFGGLKVFRRHGTDWLRYSGRSLNPTPVREISGNVTVTAVDGGSTDYVLDEDWRRANCESHAGALPPRVPFPLKVAALQLCGEPDGVELVADTVETHFGGRYLFYVSKPGKVCFRGRQVYAPVRYIEDPIVITECATGDCTQLKMPGEKSSDFTFEAERAGLYRLRADIERGGRFVFEATNVPLAIDVSERPHTLRYSGVPTVLALAVPGGREFALVAKGEDRGGFAFILRNSIGKSIVSADYVGSDWEVFRVPAAQAEKGVWRLEVNRALDRPCNYICLDVRGVPGALFLSPDRTVAFGQADD